MRWPILTVVLTALALSACGDSTRTLETAVNRPETYATYRPADLNIPPEFARRPNKDDANKRVVPNVRVYFTRNRGPEVPENWRTMSRGTQAYLMELKAYVVDEDIRGALNRESSIYVFESESLTQHLLFGSAPQSITPLGTDGKIVISREKTGILDKIGIF